jgi:hypothetical protein
LKEETNIIKANNKNIIVIVDATIKEEWKLVVTVPIYV